MKRVSLFLFLIGILLGNDGYASAQSLVQEDSKTTEIYKTECDDGIAAACHELGKIYAQGVIVDKDLVKSIELYRKACDGDYYRACTNLALAYRKGAGVERDDFQAAELYNIACNGGDKRGCFFLAKAYENGRGVKQDLSKVAEIYVKACDLGLTYFCGGLASLSGSATGLNAKNSANVGSVVGSRVGGDSKNVTVSGAVIQSTKGLNSTPNSKPNTGLPPFPWPPEAPSWLIEMPRKGDLSVGKSLSVSDVQSLLAEALGAADYKERRYYNVPNGFALVTRIEGISKIGEPLDKQHRYLVSNAEKPFSLSNYILELFVAPKGMYRFLVFIVSDVPFVPTNKSLSEDDAIDRLAKGASSFPSKRFTDSKFTDDHSITVLIYEYELTAPMSLPILRLPGVIDTGDHLSNSGISSALNDYLYGAEIIK